MPTETINYSGTLDVVTCWCGIRHAIPDDLHRHARSDASFVVYCPLGHKWVHRKSDATVEREKREAAEARAGALSDQLAAAIAEGEATRRRLIRDRHRFAHGVCPCCNRSFTNVARHMATQHPGYDPSKLAGEARARCSCGRDFATPHGLSIHQARQRGPGWAEPGASRWAAHLTVTP